MKTIQKITVYSQKILFSLLILFTFSNYGNAQGVLQHLKYLGHEATYNKSYQPPTSLADRQNGYDELHTKLMKIINLYPLPEKTPFNIHYVGDKVDLGNCYYQRVVFESRPKIYVAAHLYIPKNVVFPVPAVIQVPGHSRRDAYRPHPRSYAENGFVAIGLPMVGEEGKSGAGWGKCGEYGPYVGHFNWFNTGYNAIGPTVWDGIRAVDFLLTLTSNEGQKMVDKNKIGMTGLSGGSARTLWTAAADPRISCAVVNEGYSAIDGYEEKPGGVASTCDIHLFPNFYGLPYGALYSLIAPRPLLVQLGTKDHLYPNPQPVTDYLTKIYDLYDKADHFSVLKWDQGHGYSPDIWKSEHKWIDKWLRNGDSPISILTEKFDVPLSCFPNGEPSDIKNTEKVYTLPTPQWTVRNKADYKKLKDSLLPKMREEIMPAAFANFNSELKSKVVEKTSDYTIEKTDLSLDNNSIVHHGYFFHQNKKAKTTVVCILSEDKTLDELKDFYNSYFKSSKTNLYCTYITGSGSNKWEEGTGFLFDRFAMLTGYTRSSLRVKDIVAAVNGILETKAAKGNKIYVWGKENYAVPVLYAAVANTKINGIILENAQDKHIGITPEKETKCSTAMFNILKYADIPQVAALVYPREIVLAGEHKAGYNWTENVYSLLKKGNQFVKTGTETSEIINAIK